MANLNTTTSGYPATVDTAPTLTDQVDTADAAHQNGRGSAIVNIQTELGTDPAGSATDVKTRLAVALNDDGTIKSSVIVANTPTSVDYSSGVFTLTTTPARALSGQIVQLTTTVVTGFTTTNGIIPVDNTPPTSSEGSNFNGLLSVDLLPTSTANRVYVVGNFHASTTVSPQIVWALFLAGSSSAVTGGASYIATAGVLTEAQFIWRATTVSTATTTYAVRIGNAGAGTLTLNGEAGAGLFNDSVASTLTVYEVQN